MGGAYFKVSKAIHVKLQNLFIASFQLTINNYHYDKNHYRTTSYFGCFIVQFFFNMHFNSTVVKIWSDF